LYRSKSKEELNEKNRTYGADDKERLLEAGSQRIAFEGGCTVRKDNFIRHKTT
jgi:hypothetical protein